MRKQTKAKYVDGFVLVVPKSKVAAYRKMARDAGKFWVKHGALGYKECMGDDLNPDTGGESIQTFPKMVNLKKSETVWFSYIEYKSKKHRDQVNAKVIKEMERIQKDNPDHMKNMPFDMKQLAWGGFKVAVDL